MRVLHVSNMWPAPGMPHFGVFVEAQIDSLRRLGITCEVVHARRDYLGLRRRTREALESDAFDLVHAHFGYTAAVVADVCSRSRTPLLVSYCGGDINGEEGRERTEIIPNGVDLDCFVRTSRDRARARLGWDDAVVVLFGGRRLDPTKNYRLAEAAVQQLTARGMQAKLIPLEGVPHDQVPVWLSAADVVLLTSLREGSPNIVKEAMACDSPVVAVPVGDVAWLLEGVANSRLCSYDPKSVADGIAKVLTAESGGGREKIRALGLDSDSVARKLEALYLKILGRASP
ncbi:MAG: glycosyltransferase family 4 protein [Betaproteobacteria bacterium]|nr:MAG: glycosyltransferase family 4 protein [Betaproteobacteria bacterium]